jgi:polysaccharide chain length determinant protein (PEP-CTERM system associated)
MTDLRALAQYYIIGFWERRWSIILIAWALSVAGWLFVATMPDRFEARARIYVDTETILGPLMRGLAITPDVSTQVEMMRRTILSRPNLEELIRLTDLDLTVQNALGREKLLDRLADSIQMRTEGKDLFQIAYTSTDRQNSYRVVDSLLQIFVEQNLGRTQRDVEEARTFIDKQIVEYDTKLRDAEVKVADFQQAHAEELNGSRLAQQRLDQGQERLRQMRMEYESVVWRRDQLHERLAGTPRRVPATQVAPEKLSRDEERLADMKRQLDELRLVYTDRHPVVISLQARIEQLEHSMPAKSRSEPDDGMTSNPLYDQLSGELETANNVLAELRRRIEFAEGEVDRLGVTAASAPQVEADLKRLTRDYEVLSEQYTQLIQRREAAQLAQRLDTETKSIQFRIVDPPLVPLTPVGPPHGLLMLAVVVLGLGAGFGTAFLRMMIADSVVSADQLQETFGLPVIGSISIVRSALHANVRIVERAALGGTIVGLIATSSFMFYVYQLSGHKPDLAAIAAGLQDRLHVSLPAI